MSFVRPSRLPGVLAAFLLLAHAARAATSPVLWSAALGAPIYSSPRAIAGRVVVASAQARGANLFGLNPASGAVLWRSATGGPIQTRPAVAGGQVFVTFDTGSVHHLRALDATDGTRLWDYLRDQPPECMCSHRATAGAGLLFTQTDGHSLYAFRPAGTAPSRRLWRFVGDGARLTQPVVADGIVVFGSADHHVYARDASTGAALWTARTGYGFVAPPRILGQEVLAANRGGTLHAWALRTGRPLWSFAAAGPIDTAPVLVDGRVIVASQARTVDALGPHGRLRWHLNLPDRVVGAPLPVGRRILLAGRDGVLRAVSVRTGRMRWQTPLGGVPLSGPRRLGAAVVVKVGDHAVAAFAAATGDRLWRFTSPAVLTAPAVAGDVALVGTSAGRVVALR